MNTISIYRSDGSLEVWSEKDDWYQEEVTTVTVARARKNQQNGMCAQ